uniref:serine-rich adhesin for platelets-like isoform X3 n=1 Tax=Pristiophorus japonicus TaxID=55135 RepID=UPI00398F2AB7
MKFYHVRPKSSLKERRLTVKDLIVTFFLIIFLSVRCRACDFGRYRPHTTSYDGVIEKLRTHLPTDYNLTIFLDPAGLDSCCEDLQVMLSLKQSIGHLYRHSVGPLQDLTFKVLGELGFLKDCPVRESFNCEMKRLDSPHLFRKLLEHFRSYDNKFELKQCDFERCTLYNCVTGHIETPVSTVTPAALASAKEAGIFVRGSNATVTTETSATNRSPSLNNGTLATRTNTTNRSPSLNNGTLATRTNTTNRSPSLNNGTSATNRSPSLNNGTLATRTNATNRSPSLNNGTSATNRSPSLNNGTLATGTNAANRSHTLATEMKPSPSLINETGANRTNASSTSLGNKSDGVLAATQACSTDNSQASRSLESQTVAIILVASVLANMMFLVCLLKRKQQPRRCKAR